MCCACLCYSFLPSLRRQLTNQGSSSFTPSARYCSHSFVHFVSNHPGDQISQQSFSQGFITTTDRNQQQQQQSKPQLNSRLFRNHSLPDLHTTSPSYRCRFHVHPPHYCCLPQRSHFAKITYHHSFGHEPSRTFSHTDSTEYTIITTPHVFREPGPTKCHAMDRLYHRE